MTHQTRQRTERGNKMQHLAVTAFFLCSTIVAQAATNWVSGTAYGTNYSDLATAGSIASVESADGWLVIGYESTTNLTLAHNISGFVAITNKAVDFTVNAAEATLTSSGGVVFGASYATNLTITGGKFIGTANPGNGIDPPSQADGGLIRDSIATMSGSEFAGTNGTAGLRVERSELTASNVTVRSGEYGTGLIANDNSMVTIRSGSFTGGAGNTAFWLQNSDVTIYDGTFIGNIGGPTNVVGTGLFSELTDATTNHVTLHGGTFSSLAFFNTNGAVQHFLAGTNLVVQNGIVQDNGTVIVDNQTNSALQQVQVLSGGTMEFVRDFTLGSNGVFTLINGSMAFSNDFTLGSNSELTLYKSQLAVTGDMEIDSDSLLAITISTGGYATVTADTATFQTNSTIQVDASEGGFTSPTNDLNVLETTTGIFVDSGSGSTNATTANFNSNVNINVTTDWLTTYNGAFIDGNEALRLQFITQSWREGWGADGQLGKLADELELLDDGTMAAIIKSLGNEASQAATEQTYFTTMNTFQTVLNGMQAAVGQSVSRGAEYREQLKLKPSGGRGPQRKNDLRGWAKYYGQRYYHDADGLNREYETQLDGGVIGVDKSFGGLLVGIDGGYGRYSTTSDTDDEEDITAYHGSLYGTLGLDTAYIDAGVAYGFNQVENKTSDPFVLNGEFDAQILSAYLGGGIDLVDATEGMVFTPEASIQYSMYEQDAYSETSDIAVPRHIDAFDADSLRGSVGLNVSVQESMKLQTFSLKYDLRFHWIREFNPDPGTMNFSLEGGSNDYQLAHPMLDEDIYRAGFGVAFFNTLRNQPKNVMFRIDFDELFGDGFNSHNLSAKVIYAF